MLKTQTTLEIFHKQRTESEYCFLSHTTKKKEKEKKKKIPHLFYLKS